MLRLGFRLALTTVKRTFAQIADVAQDLLLTQADDNIITQNGDFVVRTRRPAGLILLQSGDFRHTQDDKFVEESFF